jgi:tripartite-type tricarboxylate transporter receptor subunit TctC
MSARPLRCVVAFVVAGMAACASAQYPNRPVRLVVGWPPGGAADTAARPLAQALSDALGRPVVVDNRGGATGTIGASLVAKAVADGYTLFHGTSNELVLSPYEKMPYDPIADFAPISLVISFPSVLVVHPSMPVQSVKEFVQFARARPGKLNVATAGLGATTLSGEMFKQLTAISFAYVSYKGGGPAIVDLVGGHVDAMFATLPSAVAHIRSNRLRALLVTDRKRSPAAPQIPSATESGFPDLVLLTWNGVLAPAGTPSAIIERLNHDIVAVMGTPEMRKRMLASAAEINTSSPQEFATIIRDDLAKWTRLIQASGLRKPDTRP